MRRATSAAHLAVEETLAAASCFTGPIGYGGYLARMAPLYAALEQALDAAGVADLLADWPMRRKSGLILADLAALGVPAGPGCAAASVACGPGGMLGALYVLEGATLGGAVLARRMARHGIGPGTGGAFLDPYGTGRMAMWDAFLAVLEARDLAPAEEDELCPSAAATFALFLDSAQALAAEAAA